MKIVKFMELFFLLLIFWFFLTLNLKLLNIVIGIIVSFAIAYLSYNVIHQDSNQYKHIKIIYLIIYLFLLLFEIYKSSITYIIKMFSKDTHPIIIEIDLEITNPYIIGIIANSITLTPGTVTIDYIDKKLIVLAFSNKKHSEEKIKADIKNSFIKYFEKRG